MARRPVYAVVTVARVVCTLLESAAVVSAKVGIATLAMAVLDEDETADANVEATRGASGRGRPC